ncbi:ATP-dependent helicase hrpB [Vibrio ishigakensis]|uniref:ATP-dependent helicase hrpB n=1 Tax=Vibrio ishigakensis TaxID=1481914 RepID=A0A0B8Q2M0_9VIBR|nr:ATP-dependent helicase hrpB [Vibrio ishigakensis]
MLEPRRLAAKSIATFLASQLNEKTGQRVGYRIRGEAKISKETKLEIVTEGILTRLIQSDPELCGISMIIFDEFHERSLHADLGLALALEVQQVFNEELKLMVMSATLDQLGLDTLLPDALVLESEGRTFPIEQRYAALPANASLISHICKQTLKLVNQESGSALVFLPSVGLINACLEQLTSHPELPQDMSVLPLHGSLDFKAQQAAIRPAMEGGRKLVLTTNIAETSLTIDGVRMVIDSGLENQSSFDIASGVTKLEQKRISQSSAIQRAGRAGRTQAGICLRLYSESQFNQSAFHTPPEILRSDLSSLLLEASGWGARQLGELQWLDKPSYAAEKCARELLQRLSLLASDHSLTQEGERALHLGLEPRLAAILLRAPQVLSSTAIACAVVSEEPMRNSDDLQSQVLLFTQGKHQYQKRLQTRAKSLAERIGTEYRAQQVELSKLGLCLSFGYPDRVAIKRGKESNTYRLASGVGAFVDELSTLNRESMLVVVNVQRGNQADSRVLLAAPFDQEMLEQHHEIEKHTSVVWDQDKQGMRGEKQTRFGALVLSRDMIPNSEIDDELIKRGVLDYITQQGLDTLPWSDASLSLQTRVMCASEWLPEMGWPDWSSQVLVENLDTWLEPYLNSIRSLKELKKLNMLEILNAHLGWPLNQDIDKLLPVKLTVPSGANKRLEYQVGQSPKLSVKMQEMFGQPSSPTVADGRVKVTLELLSPAQRPLQVTQDLAGFWSGAYIEVQKEMKGRYPKHPWPDDPATHVATSKTKRQLNSK